MDAQYFFYTCSTVHMSPDPSKQSDEDNVSANILSSA